LLLDDLDDRLPPVGARYEINRPGPQRLTLDVPSQFSSGPDVVRASTGTRDGTSSATVSVRITE
jgi:hypothetical protein